MDLGQAHVETLARRVAAGADDVRAARRRLAATGDVDWTGTSAARFRARLTDADRLVGGLAARCDDAAGSLHAHAAALAGAGALR
ncbi:hypothetical protein [Kineococcus rhizosphaerae]|uniref:Uncharacterized protein n=1 Tax=Kineococcus rhizosphaerae TaxID=559628 RepID=A0A2T0QX72_9ACTN|nr:hypothetical protein [Kineococcus rhizosphaerae]PRY10450.1 hypothetical protein CLV37_1163 [Kineococcus rhizosphaerae]